MLSGLLIAVDILVGLALVAVVLMQRSEGGAFGMGGGPTGLITARGAGDLLTRTTWVLFALFVAISLSLTLLGEHDKATSSVINALKLQQANPAALGQKAPTAPAPAPGLPLGAPPPAAGLIPPGPLSAPAPQSLAPPASPPAAAAPTSAPEAARKPHKSAEAAPAPTLEAPPPASTPAPTNAP